MLAVLTMYNTFYRIEDMNFKFPLQNQSTEDSCLVVKETEEEMVRVAIKKYTLNDYYAGCRVENMKQYILSDLCLTQKEGSLPSVKKCNHKDQMR